MRQICFSIVIMALIAGCVAIDVPDVPDRYSADTLVQVEIGTTTREEMILLLGMPKHTGRNGQTFFYRWELSGEMAMVVVPVPLNAALLVFGSVSFESVRVDFDSSGVVSELTPRNETLSVPTELNKYIGYTMAFPKEDTEAKGFVANSNACTAYLYVNRVGGDEWTTAFPRYIKIDRQLVGNVGTNDWYYRQVISPGQHTIIILDREPQKVGRFYHSAFFLSLAADSKVLDSLTFDCVAGEIAFFEVRIGLFTSYPELKHIASVEGRKAVNKRRLLIAPEYDSPQSQSERPVATAEGILLQQKSQPEYLRVAILPFARPRTRGTNSQAEFDLENFSRDFVNRQSSLRLSSYDRELEVELASLWDGVVVRKVPRKFEVYAMADQLNADVALTYFFARRTADSYANDLYVVDAYVFDLEYERMYHGSGDERNYKEVIKRLFKQLIGDREHSTGKST